jgi:hypothetical protein
MFYQRQYIDSGGLLKYDNEPSVSMKFRKFLDVVSDFYFLTDESSPQSCFD